MAETGKTVPSGKLLLEVVTPDKLLVSEYVDQVSAPGAEGDFGVLPGHCHFLTTLRIGELHYRIGEAEHFMSVLWGFVDVTPRKVTVLAEIAEKPRISTLKGPMPRWPKPKNVSSAAGCRRKSKRPG